MIEALPEKNPVNWIIDTIATPKKILLRIFFEVTILVEVHCSIFLGVTII